MANGLAVDFIEGNGPCGNQDCHPHLNALEQESSRSDAGPIPVQPTQPCQQALLWLLGRSSDADCTRLLLRARGILSTCPDAFCATYAGYSFWPAYGTVLGELLSRSGKTHAEVPSEEVWYELSDRFTGKTQSWELRASVIQCLQKVALETSHVLFQEDSLHFNPFWAALDTFCRYVQGTIQNAPDAPGLRGAVGAMVELCYRLTRKVTTLYAPPAVAPHVWQRRLAEFAAELLEWVVAADLPLSPGLANWHWTIGRLAEHTRGRRRPEVQQVLGRVAARLNELKDAERREVFRVKYGKILGDMIPLLHDRGRTDPRKILRPGDEACALLLKGPHGEDIGSFAGVIRNVDPTRSTGLCLETEALVADAISDGNMGLTGDHVDGFSCRSLQGTYVDKQGHAYVTEVVVNFHFSWEEQKVPISIQGKVVRSWPLRDRAGAGMAILAPPAVRDSLPPTWREYLPQCPDAGRYSP